MLDFDLLTLKDLHFFFTKSWKAVTDFVFDSKFKLSFRETVLYSLFVPKLIFTFIAELDIVASNIVCFCWLKRYFIPYKLLSLKRSIIAWFCFHCRNNLQNFSESNFSVFVFNAVFQIWYGGEGERALGSLGRCRDF